MLITDGKTVRKVYNDNQNLKSDILNLRRVESSTGVNAEVLIESTIYYSKTDLYISFIEDTNEVHICSPSHKGFMPLCNELIDEITEFAVNRDELRDTYYQGLKKLINDFYALNSVAYTNNNLIELTWEDKNSLLMRFVVDAEIYLTLNEDMYENIRNWNASKELPEFARNLASLIMSQLALRISAK